MRLLSAIVMLGLLGPVLAHAEEEAAATYVGSEMCEACHQEAAEVIAATPHGTLLTDESLPEAKRGCEACHGPGSAHVDAPGEGPIRAFEKSDPPDARSAPCRGCHAGKPSLHGFLGGEHALAGLACPDCHQSHQKPVESLLRRPVPGLCYSCHAEVRARFALPEHHEVDEGVLSCLDCHEPHGSRNDFDLLSAHDRTCTRCHQDFAGPFVFEHKGLITEGCQRCHEPHGSFNRHLLKRQLVAQLCYQCHTVTPSDHAQPSFRDCTRCHVAIHGSNTDPRFLER